MGIGFVGITCKELNRNFIEIEIDKKYFDIAKARIEYVCELPRKDKEKTSIVDLLEEIE